METLSFAQNSNEDFNEDFEAERKKFDLRIAPLIDSKRENLKGASKTFFEDELAVFSEQMNKEIAQHKETYIHNHERAKVMTDKSVTKEEEKNGIQRACDKFFFMWKQRLEVFLEQFKMLS
jgi:hypothetical protein